MKHVFFLFLSTVVAFIQGFSYAQENHLNCGYHQSIQALSASNPKAFNDYGQFAQQVRSLAEKDPVTHKTTYIIPVVFHIVHEYGSENISDLQVLNQLEILNRDFRKLNEDISDLVAGFDTLAADVNIEFRLATIDPSGVCTNGIEHIYSHETNVGDDYSKVNQWPRNKYLNIWVFRSMMAGIAGFATPPTLSDALFYTDGIGILNSYTGAIGTGNTFTSRNLTHEIGHFLGLIHPWGSGDPGILCGNDGIVDTPETKGFSWCPSTPENASICNPLVVENYQNFMDMSFCQRMFTHDQAEFIRSVLNASNAERNNLITDINLSETGVFANPTPICTPVADFVSLLNVGMSGSPNKFFCEGDEIRFRDVSWNAGVTNRTWYFEDGIPSTSNEVDPIVVFSGLGWKRVKLVVSNSNGADSLISLHAIHLSQSWADKTGPYSEDFESGNVLSWLVDNKEENHAKWQLSNTSGKDNSKCMKLNNYKDVSGAVEFSEDYFYNFRLGGNKDILISPSNDLTNTSGSELIFDYAYSTKAQVIEEATESLKIYISKKLW